jgi:GWxTD domain-containing protein
MFCVLVFSVACSTTRQTVKPDVVSLSKLYNPTGTKLHPAYTIFHNQPSGSLLLIKIFPTELLFSGTIEPDKLLGLVNLSYVMTDITDVQKPTLADSGKVTFRFLRENADKRFTTQIPIKAEAGKKYQLAVTARDMVRNESALTYLHIDKTSALSEQNFLISYAEDRTPLYKPYVVGDATVRIDFSNNHYDSVYVSYYGSEIPLPRPSFSTSREREFLNKPDSLWVFPFAKAVSYKFNYKGIYHLQLDTTVDAGLTLTNFGASYPRVQDVDQLVESLAYLTTSAEYDKLINAINKKLAVDNFWIERTGDLGKARELIRVYYNRVFFANYYFTSFKPGWKTDRGMIYIIYGPPQSVKVEPGQEKWIYYKNNLTTTVTFTFDHTPGAFSVDNFSLQRSDSYDTFWRSAVDTWRNGKIYLIE